MQRLSELGAETLSQTLERYADLTPRPQNEIDASFAPLMKKEDGLVSWGLAAAEIRDRVRGFQPFPTAFTYFREKRLTIWKCDVVTADHQPAEAGEIVSAHGDELLVFCGRDSVLKIDELQPEGKRRAGARDFINGVRPQPGDIMGA